MDAKEDWSFPWTKMVHSPGHLHIVAMLVKNRDTGAI